METGRDNTEEGADLVDRVALLGKGLFPMLNVTPKALYETF